MPRNSIYIGVRLCEKNGKQKYWRAEIQIEKRAVSITGQFKTAREAAIAYDKVAIRYNKQTNILKQQTK